MERYTLDIFRESKSVDQIIKKIRGFHSQYKINISEGDTVNHIVEKYLGEKRNEIIHGKGGEYLLRNKKYFEYDFHVGADFFIMFLYNFLARGCIQAVSDTFILNEECFATNTRYCKEEMDMIRHRYKNRNNMTLVSEDENHECVVRGIQLGSEYTDDSDVYSLRFSDKILDDIYNILEQDIYLNIECAKKDILLEIQYSIEYVLDGKKEEEFPTNKIYYDFQDQEYYKPFAMDKDIYATNHIVKFCSIFQKRLFGKKYNEYLFKRDKGEYHGKNSISMVRDIFLREENEAYALTNSDWYLFEQASSMDIVIIGRILVKDKEDVDEMMPIFLQVADDRCLYQRRKLMLLIVRYIEANREQYERCKMNKEESNYFIRNLELAVGDIVQMHNEWLQEQCNVILENIFRAYCKDKGKIFEKVSQLLEGKSITLEDVEKESMIEKKFLEGLYENIYIVQGKKKKKLKEWNQDIYRLNEKDKLYLLLQGRIIKEK